MPASKNVQKLGPMALAIVSLAVIVSVGSIVLAQMQGVAYADTIITNEPHQPASLDTNVTIDEASKQDFVRVEPDTETITLYDKSANTNTTLDSNDYKSYYDDGKFYLKSTPDTNDYNSSEDTFYFDYTANYKSSSSSVLNTGISSLKTFADFFTVIVVIGIAAILFLLLRSVRGASRTASV